MKKKVGRNDPCPCGSGKKFKKCCERKMIGRKFMAHKIEGSNLTAKINQATGTLSSFFKGRVVTHQKTAGKEIKATKKEESDLFKPIGLDAFSAPEKKEDTVVETDTGSPQEPLEPSPAEEEKPPVSEEDGKTS